MKRREIKKVLIANRGEIALRIQRAAQKLGIKSVCIASDADKTSMFARNATELVLIGGSAPQDSYLNIEKIIKAAKDSGCDAVHPGYGFLSENADFAARVIKEGMIFIGPTPEAIKVLGSKTLARKAVTENGVPTTPGCVGGLSDEEIIKEAKQIGFPVIVKAVAGGGGRGMRVVNSAKEMEDTLPRARAEAKKNFASEDVYIEKYILMPRHVEVQIFGDAHGDVVHFGTRDCSTQRRHQKLIEEAPAPFMSDKLRESIHDAAVKAAKSVGYVNAGTAEFLVSGESYYFLEMNTRIQVEHPITEEVTGTDLVALQFEVAMGGKVPKQKDIKFTGHAIEFRIYAEDPERNFSPVIGKVTEIRRFQESFVREDYGFESGDEVTPYYDAMLSKLIIKGATRDEAIDRSIRALKIYKVEGLKSTVPFHKWILQNKTFRETGIDIGFLEREFKDAPKLLAEMVASEVVDPLFKPGPWGIEGARVGVETVEFFRYRSQKFTFDYTIEVLHRVDGVFVVTPTDGASRRAKNKSCRASNGLRTALRSVIHDVLEGVPPTQVF